jgi:hypothetical protein
MAQQGGKRPGAGRPKGARDKLTREAGATLSELARAYTDQALEVLVQIAVSGESEAARVSAANALLDRGYGKASQPIEATSKVTVVLDGTTADL